jgi:hypothetical protein
MVKKSFMSQIQPTQETVIRRGRVASIDLYEIKESELEILEKGSNADIYLNFSIALLSLSISITTAFFSATFTNKLAETFFIVIDVIGFIIGLILLFLWYRGRKDVRIIIKAIRDRMPPEVVITGHDSISIPTTSVSTTTETTRPQG